MNNILAATLSSSSRSADSSILGRVHWSYFFDSKHVHEFASISGYDDTYTLRSCSWIASLQVTSKVRKLSICLGFTLYDLL
jgi:hypothetical protein